MLRKLLMSVLSLILSTNRAYSGWIEIPRLAALARDDSQDFSRSVRCLPRFARRCRNEHLCPHPGPPPLRRGGR